MRLTTGRARDQYGKFRRMGVSGSPTSITVTIDQLPAALKREGLRHLGAAEKAARGAALKLRMWMVRETDKLGITDMGTYKAAFRATPNSVENDAPHAGLVELGARPHAVSEEGQEAIKRWCMRKLGLDEKEATSAAYLICRKIKKEGQKPHYIFRDALPLAIQYYAEELNRIIYAGARK